LNGRAKMASMASYNMPSVKNCDMASMLGKCELKCLQWLATKTVSLFFSASISSRHMTVNTVRPTGRGTPTARN